MSGFGNLREYCSSNEQSSSDKKSSSTRQSGLSIEKKSRDESARERNRLAQKRFRVRRKQELEKKMEEVSRKDQECLDLISEQKKIVATMKAKATLLSVRKTLFTLYKPDEPPAIDPDSRADALPAAEHALPSLVGNMASLILETGYEDLASVLTGQIESEEFSAQFVSDPEEAKCLSSFNNASELQTEFQKRITVLQGMMQAAEESGGDALAKLKGDPEFLAHQFKTFTFVWSMFHSNPSLGLTWFAENSANDLQKYAKAAEILYAKVKPDGIERLRKLHSCHTLQQSKRQARLQLVMDKVKKALQDSSSFSEYSAQNSASMYVTLQECTDAICEVGKEEFRSLVPFIVAFLSEFELIDHSVMLCHMAPQILDTYAMVTALLREDFYQKSLKK